MSPAQEYRLIQGETLSLRVGVDVPAALERMVSDGVRAFPKRGLEVGGILTGSLAGEIRLDAVRPLPMEYRSGPLFRPSAADFLFVKQSVLSAQLSGAGIVGHFRSQTSGGPAPTDTDQTIADLLQVQEPLLLLIPASAAGIEQVRVYRRVNGAWAFLLSFPLVEFPLDHATSHTLPKQQDIATAGLPIAVPHSRWRWWALGLVVGLGCGAYLSRSVWQTRPAYVLPTRSNIGLEVRPSGAGLKVQWNPASPPVAEAFSGLLAVQDGSRRLQIPLDRRQLHAGSTIYVPESDWVEVRLEIYRDGNHYTGEAVAMATGLAKLQPGRNPTGAPGAAVNPPPQSSARKQPAAAPRTNTVLPLPPQISLAQPAPAVLPPPAVPAPPPVRSPENSGPAANSLAPFSPAEASIRYETAVPIRKVRPAVPADLHSRLPESISIEIKIEIDAAGKVVNASYVGDLTAAQKLLAPQALQAARLWRFEPARRNGEAVKSESLLRFDFERDAH